MASTPIMPVGPSSGDPALRIEDRRAPRYTLLLRQAKLRTRDGEFLCVIRDVSISGISVRTFHPLPQGDRFAIELREGCPYLVEKVWERDGEAGFKFRDPVALDEILDDDARYPRRQMRVDVDLTVEISSGSERSTGQLLNISQQGARLDASRSWARDQLVRIEAKNLPMLYAKVRWRRDFTHGLVFEETFSLRDFAYLLARFHSLV